MFIFNHCDWSLSCLYIIRSVNIEHLLTWFQRKWDLHNFSMFIVVTVIGTKSIVPQKNAVGIPILQEEIVLI